MKAFKLDSKGDLVFKNGDLVMIDGNEEMVQSVERILTTNIEEWFLDLDFGLDYGTLQGKGREKERIKLALENAIYQDERIKSVDIKDVDLDDFRNLKINGTATDIDGNLIDLGVVNIE